MAINNVIALQKLRLESLDYYICGVDSYDAVCFLRVVRVLVNVLPCIALLWATLYCIGMWFLCRSIHSVVLNAIVIQLINIQ